MTKSHSHQIRGRPENQTQIYTTSESILAMLLYWKRGGRETLLEKEESNWQKSRVDSSPENLEIEVYFPEGHLGGSVS